MRTIETLSAHDIYTFLARRDWLRPCNGKYGRNTNQEPLWVVDDREYEMLKKRVPLAPERMRELSVFIEGYLSAR